MRGRAFTYGSRIAWCALLCSTACAPSVREAARAQPGNTGIKTSLERLGPSTWLFTGDASAWAGDAPASTRLVEGQIRCDAPPGRDPIRFWTYERRGVDEAYGVYGLGLAKNPMIVPLPLAGTSVTLPGLPPLQALLRIAAYPTPPTFSNDGEAKLDTRLRSDGKRVVFVLRGSAIPPNVAREPGNVVFWVHELH
ncbi:MAG: hypothetical protein H6833_11280 [Planctomycetes bacterium]|nr:hypothetical protein [Planctomycetota bacterium]